MSDNELRNEFAIARLRRQCAVCYRCAWGMGVLAAGAAMTGAFGWLLYLSS
jgi:hypothetical protein